MSELLSNGVSEKEEILHERDFLPDSQPYMFRLVTDPEKVIVRDTDQFIIERFARLMLSFLISVGSAFLGPAIGIPWTALSSPAVFLLAATFLCFPRRKSSTYHVYIRGYRP